MALDLWSAEYYEQKSWERVKNATPADFEPWEEARERYIQRKIEPTLQLYRQSDHDFFKDWNRRKGEVMHSSDLIIRLQKLNSHIQVQQQYNFENDWGLYSSERGRLQFLTGMPKAGSLNFRTRWWMTEICRPKKDADGVQCSSIA